MANLNGKPRAESTRPLASLAGTRPRADGEPVELPRHKALSKQFFPRSNNHRAILRPNRDHEHRLWESTRYAPALSDREPRVPIVLTDHLTVRQQERPLAQCRRVRAQLLANDLGVIAVRHEADILALDFLGHDLEPQLVRHSARLCLGLSTHRQDHARQDGAIDPP